MTCWHGGKRGAFKPEAKREGTTPIIFMCRSPGALKLRQVLFKLMVPLSVRFSLIKHHLVEFTQLAMANSEGSDHMLNRVMPKDNIGLAALLKTKEPAWEAGIYLFKLIKKFNQRIKSLKRGYRIFQYNNLRNINLFLLLFKA